MINFHKQSIVQATFLLTAIAFLSKILGFLREVTIANVFGASAITDAYLVASVLPGIVAGLIGGSLTTVFIPVFLEEREKKRGTGSLAGSKYHTERLLCISGYCHHSGLCTRHPILKTDCSWLSS